MIRLILIKANLRRIEDLKDKTRKEFKLSEIVLKTKNNELNLEINKIKSSINEIGFKNTANIYSISESAKLGGDIGWINENNLSEKIFNKIVNLQKMKFQMSFKLEIITFY